jgi:DNA-binding NtrC family response regulator
MLHKPVKLLIIEDDDSTRASLTNIFSELGYLVRSGANGFSGLSEIRREIPDVLLSDLNMVRIPGLEFLMVVRRWLPSIRAIAMARVFSGNRVPPGVAADALVQKSAGPARLIKTVDAITQPRRSNCRLSMENSHGFQVLEEIPSHPDIEQLTFPAPRAMEIPAPHTEHQGRMFLVPTVTPDKVVCFS